MTTEERPYAPAMGKQQPLTGFGERLKAARQKAKLSGTALGKGLQIHGDASRQTVSDWEAERHYPTVWQLHHLCLRLGTSADELLGLLGSVSELSEQERALVAAYRTLPATERPAVLRAAGATQVGKAPVSELPNTDDSLTPDEAADESLLRGSSVNKSTRQARVAHKPRNR
jgi:transcriptional regulator with XRE-family HTH domain